MALTTSILTPIAVALVTTVAALALGALSDHIIQAAEDSAAHAPKIQPSDADTHSLEKSLKKELNNRTLHSRYRTSERDINSDEVIDKADEVLYDENGNQVYVWHQGDGQSQVTIRDPSNGNIVTNQWSPDRWIERQIEKGRWFGLD